MIEGKASNFNCSLMVSEGFVTVGIFFFLFCVLVFCEDPVVCILASFLFVFHVFS